MIKLSVENRYSGSRSTRHIFDVIIEDPSEDVIYTYECMSDEDEIKVSLPKDHPEVMRVRFSWDDWFLENTQGSVEQACALCALACFHATAYSFLNEEKVG